MTTSATGRNLHSFRTTVKGAFKQSLAWPTPFPNHQLERWADPKAIAGKQLPDYWGTGRGNVAAGGATFRRVCASCHGPSGDGEGGSARGSVVDPAFLALVSDQSLRSTVIFGRLDLGMPDWAGYSTEILSDQDIADLVAWLASRRVEFPGRPYPGQEQKAVVTARENADG